MPPVAVAASAAFWPLRERFCRSRASRRRLAAAGSSASWTTDPSSPALVVASSSYYSSEPPLSSSLRACLDSKRPGRLMVPRLAPRLLFLLAGMADHDLRCETTTAE